MRYRYDGFTEGKRGKFFAVLEKTGCLADAADAAGVSKETVRRWRVKDEAFEAEFERRLSIAGGGLERTAWERASVGVEEKIWRNGKLWQVRVKPSDAMLRLLLQGSNPDKYGRLSHGGMTAKQIEKRLRTEIEAEMEEKYKPKHADLDEMCLALARRLKQFPPTPRVEPWPRPGGPEGGGANDGGAEGEAA